MDGGEGILQVAETLKLLNLRKNPKKVSKRSVDRKKGIYYNFIVEIE